MFFCSVHTLHTKKEKSWIWQVDSVSIQVGSNRSQVSVTSWPRVLRHDTTHTGCEGI